jgi:hypothetical protein
MALSAGLLYLVVASFPLLELRSRGGLEASWVYGINAFTGQGFVFGRDLNFTYGPLGFLLVPFHYGHHLLFAALARAVVQLIFGLLLLRAAWRAHR